MRSTCQQGAMQALTDQDTQLDLVMLDKVAGVIDKAIRHGGVLVESDEAVKDAVSVLLSTELAVYDRHGAVRLSSSCAEEIVSLKSRKPLSELRMQIARDDINSCTPLEVQATLLNAGFALVTDHTCCNSSELVVMRFQCLEYYHLLLQSFPDDLLSLDDIWHNQ